MIQKEVLLIILFLFIYSHVNDSYMFKSNNNMRLFARSNSFNLKATTTRPPTISQTDSYDNNNNNNNNKDMKLGVLLLNLGGPETQDDVEGFLYNLFADPDIIRLPGLLSFIQKPLAYFIAKRRAPKSAAAYESIGGGSPIVKYTKEQAQLVEKELATRIGSSSAIEKENFNPKVYFAMRYWHPFTDAVLDTMYEDGINSMVIIPLYPQFSISTSGSSLRVLQDLFYQSPERWSPDGPNRFLHTVVASWYYREGYIKSMASLIIKEIESFSYEQRNSKEGVHVLYSAHGVPKSYIEAGDPYQVQMEECVALISKKVGELLLQGTDIISKDEGKRLVSGMNNICVSDANQRKKKVEEEVSQRNTKNNDVNINNSDGNSKTSPSSSSILSGEFCPSDRQGGLVFHLSFQSRVGPVKWLEPYTEERLPELGQQGVKNLVCVPVSFVSEHIETLEEIDMEYRELAEENGIENWRRVPALNTDHTFITDMADLVMEALSSPIVTVSEASSQQSELSIGSDAQLAAIDPSQKGFGMDEDFSLSSFKFSRGAELINGRLAMVAFLTILLAENISQSPILKVLGLE